MIRPLHDGISSILSASSTSQTNNQIWQTLVTAFRYNKPGIKPIELKYNMDWNLPHEDEEVPDRAMMTTSEVVTMRRAHSHFVERIRSQPIQLAHKAGTQGIATTAAAAGLPVVVISLHMLRQTKSSSRISKCRDLIFVARSFHPWALNAYNFHQYLVMRQLQNTRTTNTSMNFLPCSSRHSKSFSSWKLSIWQL